MRYVEVIEKHAVRDGKILIRKEDIISISGNFPTVLRFRSGKIVYIEASYTDVIRLVDINNEEISR